MKKLIEPIFDPSCWVFFHARVSLRLPGKLIAVTHMFPMCLGPDDGTPGDVGVRGRFGHAGAVSSTGW